MKDFIFGKDHTKNIVSIDVKDDIIHIFKEDEFGITHTHYSKQPSYWVLLSEDKDKEADGQLKGDLHYKHYHKFERHNEYKDFRSTLYQRRVDAFSVPNLEESQMVKYGLTYYKGSKVKEVSVLSFDIETNGISLNKKSKVFLISNTFKKDGKVTKKLFSLDEYKNQKEMIYAWTKWVRNINPSIMVGHNIFGFDLPYLYHCSGKTLELGRDGSKIEFAKRPSKFRKDGSQSYDYKNVTIFGREVIDTFFLSIKYDIGRKYSSYSLKTIINEEGLEREARTFYDAKTIKDNWEDPQEREKIKEYCIDDADDSLALYELMIPSFFYLAQSIPMTLQQIINRASGSQINSFMVRSYLQTNHSIPKATEVEHFKGGISFGNAGIYQNVYKVDVASLYPSIIRQYKIYDRAKDPNAHFLKMVDYFTEERLANKAKGKETGDRYYKDLEQSQKIMINSAYGFMGARGLNFNSPHSANRVTSFGRAILGRGIRLTENMKLDLTIVNADTDSFSFARSGWFSFDKYIKWLNGHFRDKIIWEDDGVYDSVVIVKAKNYALKQGDKTSIKGSALKASMKEPRLKEFNKQVLSRLLSGDNDIVNVYDNLAKEIGSISDISDWCSKKTITDKVLNPQRTNERRILDAINGKKVQEGDKINVFFKTPKELCLAEDFSGEYDKDKLYEKLFKTIKVFEPVLDIKEFPNYKLKRNVERRPK